MSLLPVLPIALPLLTAALLGALQRVAPRWFVDTLAWLVSASVAAIGLILLVRTVSHPIVYWFGGWKPLGPVSIGIDFYVDPIASGLVALMGVLVTASFTYSWHYVREVRTLFHLLVLVFLGAMAGFALSGDLFTMFVLFELMGVAAYALTGYHAEEKGPIEGSFNFAVTNSLGAFMILTAIGLVYGRTGALNLAQIGLSLSPHAPDGLVIVAFVLLCAGFFTKAAIVPFHFWLADAHAVAPAPVCVLFSGVMVELGLYAIARIFWTAFVPAFSGHLLALRIVLVSFGVLTALLGAVLCMAQHHLKRLLAYSTISHSGMMLIGLGLLNPAGLAGMLIYLAAHGMVKGALFLCAGIVLDHCGGVNELRVFGKGKHLWRAGIIFTVSALALAGFPPSGTSIGKTIIEQGARMLDLPWVPYLLSACSILTSAAILRAGGRIFYGLGTVEPPAPGSADAADESERESQTSKVPPTVLVPIVVLVGLDFTCGALVDLPHWAETAASRFQHVDAYLNNVLPSLPAPTTHAIEQRVAWGGLLPGLVCAVLAALLAAFALYRLRLPKAIATGTMKLVQAPLAGLRTLHSGHIGDYTVWLTWGVVALGGAMIAALKLAG